MINKKKLIEFIGNEKIMFHQDSGYFFGKTHNGGDMMIAEVRGWGAIQNMFEDIEEAGKFQDEFGHWVADAINEKLEREKNGNSL